MKTRFIGRKAFGTNPVSNNILTCGGKIKHAWIENANILRHPEAACAF